MTRSGHRATALALGVAGAIYLGWPSGIGWLIGCIFGASAPDYMEFHYGDGPKGHRTLLTHRTWTHQPLLWMAAIAIYWHYEFIHTPYHAAVLGWMFAGVLHLCMDMLTPMGIPLGFPWARRTSLKLHRSGGSETAFILLVWICLLTPIILPKLSPDVWKTIPKFYDLFSRAT